MKQQWHVDELVESWTLDQADLRLVRNKTGPTRLGFAVLTKFFALEARFPVTSAEVPIEAVDFLAGQLGVDLGEWVDYDWTGTFVETSSPSDPLAVRVSGLDDARRWPAR